MSRPKTKAKPWRPDAFWSGETVVCVASGPSLQPSDVAYCRDKARVLVINDNYKLAPWADLLYACDHQWWKWHAGVSQFRQHKVTQDENAAVEFDLKWYPSKKGYGLSVDRDYIHQGLNSGFQSINLAYFLGASKVLLLGYDMHIKDGSGPRWFGHHPNRQIPLYRNYIPKFNEIAEQGLIQVINCTTDSAIECFPKADIHEAL